MVLEQFLDNHSSEEDAVSIEKWKSMTTSVSPPEDNPTGGFDCNICLDLVHEPVVTLCGHLYCWPCIYKWIHLQSVSNDNLDPQCPVCKSEVSQNTLVPVYSHGQSTKPSKGKGSPHLGIVVPRRPPSPTCGAHTTGFCPPLQLHQRRNLQLIPPVLSLGSTTMTTSGSHPIFGDMVYERIFENPETTLYRNPHSYQLAGTNSPRVLRHIMETDKSLSRVCFFLCCCLVLCLLLF